MMNETPGMASLLDGQLALITGAGSGIGRAIAVTFAAAGARVILTDITAGLCEQAAKEIRVKGGQAWVKVLDVTQIDACAEMAEAITTEIGDVSLLVNSAGILVREGIDSQRAHEFLRRVTDVNYFGSFNTTHAFLPSLRRTRGNIVNIASGAAFVAQAGCIGYSSSKAAVKLLTQTLAVDLSRDGIRVNALAPGVIETPMTEATRNDPAILARFMQRTPLHRPGQPEEVAAAALFLASPQASYVNGVTLPVDGGLLAT